MTRKVTRTATAPLEGNAYAVDPALTGRRVELRYDPEDLTRIDVLLDGKPAGAATPFVTRRVHRAAALDPTRHQVIYIANPARLTRLPAARHPTDSPTPTQSGTATAHARATGTERDPDRADSQLWTSCNG